MKKILVTGVAGSGKSTTCGELKKLGYEAHDIESIRGLFQMIDKETGKPAKNHRHDDMEKVKQGEWICDKEKLGKLLKKQRHNVAFYCGTASNIKEITPLFDEVFLLKISEQTMRQRLSTRGSSEFGSTEETRDWIMEWKDWVDDRVEKLGGIPINANGSPVQTMETILSKI